MSSLIKQARITGLSTPFSNGGASRPGDRLRHAQHGIIDLWEHHCTVRTFAICTILTWVRWCKVRVEVS